MKKHLIIIYTLLVLLIIGNVIMAFSYYAEKTKVSKLEKMTNMMEDMNHMMSGTSQSPGSAENVKAGQQKILAHAVFSANEQGNSVSVLDADNFQTVMTFRHNFSNPHNIQVSPDSKTVWVTNAGDNTVSVFDAATLLPFKKFKVGEHPAHVVLTPDSTKALVTNSGSNTVEIYDARTFQYIAEIQVGEMPHGMRLSPDGGIAYIADYGQGGIDVIDVEKAKLVDHLSLDGNAVQVAVASDEIYVSLAKTKRIAVIDAKTKKLKQYVSTTFDPAQLFTTPDQQYVLIAEQGTKASPGNLVSFLHTKTKTIDASLETSPGPHGIYVEPTGKIAFVTNMFSNELTIIDVERQKIIRTVAVGEYPNGISGTVQNVMIDEAMNDNVQESITSSSAPKPEDSSDHETHHG